MPIHYALFENNVTADPDDLGVMRGARVIFGEKGDQNLLGATTLDVLDPLFDQFKRELRATMITLMADQ